MEWLWLVIALILLWMLFKDNNNSSGKKSSNDQSALANMPTQDDKDRADALLKAKANRGDVPVDLLDYDKELPLGLTESKYLKEFVVTAYSPVGKHPFTRQFDPYKSQEPIELESYLYDYTKPSYVGCYKDSVKRPAFPVYLGVGNKDQCGKAARSFGFKKYGLRNGELLGRGMGECWTGNDRAYSRYGADSQCFQYGDQYIGDTNSIGVYSW